MRPTSVARVLAACSLLLLLVTALNCEKSSEPIAPRDTIPLIDQTPRENEEAEEMALWASGELIASEKLYTKILLGVAGIREQHGDSISQLKSIDFFAPWWPGFISIELTDEARKQVRKGIYTDLDSLNKALRLTKMDTLHRPQYPHMQAHLSFKGRLHPDRLAEIYAKVPSVTRADDGVTTIGDRSNVYPWILGDAITFLFREAWGDCLSGCIYSRFWYFRVVDDHIEYVGAWDYRDKPEPGWWSEAKVAFYRYMGFPLE